MAVSSYRVTPALPTRKTTPCLSSGSKITILTYSTGIWLYHIDYARIKPNGPFLSYDARKLSSAGGSHWSDSSLSGRVSFILDGLIRGTRVKEPGKIRNSSVSTLTIHTLREEDGGIYRYILVKCVTLHLQGKHI